MVLNMLPGTGLLLAVLSPENVNVAIHSVGAVLAFIPGAIAAILSYRIIRSPFRYFAAFLGIFALLATVTEFGAYNTSLRATDPRPRWMGEDHRVPAPLWLVGFGSYLLTRSSEALR